MKEKFTKEELEKLEEIKKRASELHESVNQTYDQHPYSYHLEMVSSIMDEYVWDCEFEVYEILWFACWFHDTIEDARLTYNDVSRIALKYLDSLEDATIATEIVYALTNEKGRTRKERANQKYYQGIRETRYAPFIKACDRLANITYANETQSSMLDAYRKEMKDFLFNITNHTNEIPPELIQKLKSI